METKNNKKLSLEKLTSNSSNTDSTEKAILKAKIRPRSFFKTLIKRIGAIFSAILLIVLTVLILFGFTHKGNVWLWGQLKETVPGLKGDLVSGHLGIGWRLDNFSFINDAANINAKQLDISWTLTDLFLGQFNVENVAVLSPKISLQGSGAEKEGQPEESGQSGEITIPIDVNIKQIVVSDLTFAMPSVKLNLGRLSTGASLTSERGLVLNDTDFDRINLTLPESAEKSGKPDEIAQTQQLSSNAATAKKNDGPLQLPEILLPIPVDIPHFKVTNFHFEQGDTKENIDIAFLNVTAKKHTIILHQLMVKNNVISAVLNGKITLKNDYLLSASLVVKTNNLIPNQLENQDLEINMSGSLENLTFFIKASGDINGELLAKAQLLQSDIPFELSLNWAPLKWPAVAKKPDLSVETGSLCVNGKLSDFNLDLKTSLQAMDFPKVALNLLANGSTEQLNIKQLNVNTLQGLISLKGLLNWKDRIAWNGDVNIAGLRPSLWKKGLPDILNGLIKQRFEQVGNDWTFDISYLQVDGEINKLPLVLSGKIKGDSGNQWQSDNTLLAVGQNKVFIDGVLNKKNWNMLLNVQGNQLNEIHQDLTGNLSGNFILSGNEHNPKIKYQMEVPKLAYLNNSIQKLNSHGVVSFSNTNVEGNLELVIDRIQQNKNVIDNLKLTGLADQKHHQLTLNFTGSPVSGGIKLTGYSKNKQWHETLQKALFETPIGPVQLDQPLLVSVNLNNNHIETSKQQWNSKDAKIIIDPILANFDTNQYVKTSFRLVQFDLERFAPLLPENLGLTGAFSSHGDVLIDSTKGDAGNQFALEAAISPGVIRFNNVNNEFNQLSFDARLNNNQLRTRFTFDGNKLGETELFAQVDKANSEQLLSGYFNVDRLTLDAVKPLITDAKKISGIIKGKGTFSGTLKNPLLNGKVSLEGGEFLTLSKTVQIKKLNTLITINNDYAKINGEMNVGKGKLNIYGRTDWQTLPAKGEIFIKGKGLEISPPQIGYIKVSSDLNLKFSDSMKLAGTITIPKARIKVKELPKSAVQVSEDVVIYSKNNATQQENKATTPLYMALNIVQGNDVSLEAFGLKTKLTGHLKIKQFPGKALEGSGRVEMEEGTYTSLGQDLLIKRGNIIFSGPISSPYLDMKVIRNPNAIEDNVEVGMEVTGPVTRPELAIYSEPNLPQQQQLSYLLTGHGLNADSGSNSDALQGMLLSYGASQLTGTMNALGGAIGISDVSVNTEGSGSDTQVTISGYIAPNLQVQYGMGVFDSITELKARYEVTPNLYIQTASGLAQALDVFYKFKI